MSLRSPLSRAKGLGSAKHGFDHWWWQRLSAIALVPLCLWFVYSLISLVGEGQAQAQAWLAQPLNATLMISFVAAMLFHAQTGLQVVIEDYIHSKWLNLTLLISVKFAALMLAVLAIISVLKIVLGG